MIFKQVLRIFYLILFFSIHICSQSYQMTVENITRENTDAILFDVYLKSLDESFMLQSYQVTLSLNSEYDPETLSLSLVEGTSQLLNIPMYGVGIYNTDGQTELAFASSQGGEDIISSSKKRVGRFSITSTEAFDTTLPDLRWNFDGIINTILTTSGNIEFTNEASHKIFPGDEAPLPVELSSFTADYDGDNVILKWRTETELNNFGFEIEKSVPGRQSAAVSNDFQWHTIGFINGNGNSSTPVTYNFNDVSPGSGKWLYRLKQIDHDGTFTYSDAVEVEINSVPHKFNLSQNYPNPFNPETAIEFTVPENGDVILKVFNITGEEVATLFNDFAETGKLYKVKFSAAGSAIGYQLSSGIYFARLQFGDSQVIRKMTYLK